MKFKHPRRILTGHNFAYIRANVGCFVHYHSNICENYGKKVFTKANFLMREMFTFQCSLVRFYEPTNMSSFL